MSRFELIRNETEETVRLEFDGEIIWTPNGGWSMKDDDFLEAILDNANFDQPQKDALRALIVGPDEIIEDAVDDPS